MDERNSDVKKETFFDKYRFPKGASLMILYQLLSGMAAYAFILIFPIYMTSIMKYSAATATSIYHARSGLVYFMTILGGIIADGYLGRIWTFLIFHAIDTVLFVGILILSIYNLFTLLVILVLFTSIFGGICGAAMRAFVADQIPQDNKIMLSAFLHIIYFMNNFGVIIVGLIGPILHKDIYCFGNECYQVNISVTCILMIGIIVLICFGVIRKLFVIYPSSRNVIPETIACIYLGVKTRLKEGKNPDGHWMDYAERKYDFKFVYDCKIVLSLCFFLLAHPIFFTVFEQMTSVWTLQARFMDGMMTDTFVLKADQIQTLNPILVVIIIPIFELTVYPLLEKINFQVPYRIALGHFFTAISCLFMVFIQLMVDHAVSHPVKATDIDLTVLNLNPGSLTVNNSVTKEVLPQYETHYLSFTFESSQKYLSFIYNNQKSDVHISQWIGKSAMAVVYVQNASITTQFSLIIFQNDGGYSNVRLFNTDILSVDEEIYIYGIVGINKKFTFPVKTNGFSSYIKCGVGIFDVYRKTSSKDVLLNRITIRAGESNLLYPILVNGSLEIRATPEYIATLPKIAWQFLPYLFLTIGEVFFNVNTGIFLYSEAPLSMKSVLLSFKYLCIALGDILIIILNHIFDEDQMLYFHILCGALVCASGVATMILALIYLRDKIVRENTLTSRSN